MITGTLREQKILIHVFEFHVCDIIASIFVLIKSFESGIIKVDSFRLESESCPYPLKYPLHGVASFMIALNIPSGHLLAIVDRKSSSCPEIFAAS